MDGYLDKYFYGRRPAAPLIAPFRNVHQQDALDFQGTYLVPVSANRQGWQRGAYGTEIGSGLKEKVSKPGPWTVFMGIQGETVPRYENHVRLSTDEADDWGIPKLITSVDYTENDEAMLSDFFEQATEMLESAGCHNIRTDDSKQAPGLDIHEIGGARMGQSPENSVLNSWNQVHSCKNVFVTDGACMSSISCQNPSLTFMALTARAANHAAEEMKKGNL